MRTSTPTIAETIREIREALRDYIEATYHVGSPGLVRRRKDLLDELGVIFQAPYIESTPRYTAGTRFAELKLPGPAGELLQLMAYPGSGDPLIYDPPYRHQAQALERALGEDRSLVVTTGTGSGKTESFLLPVLGKLAVEAKERPASFARPSLRAILLYPMNALVNDQLGRLRLMFGDPQVANWFTANGGRPARFARYTSRTLYPGVRTNTKDQLRLRPIKQFYIDLLETAATDTPEGLRAATLIENLQSRGKWPAKPDLLTWYGAQGSRWKNAAGDFVRAVTMPDDPELFTRHEVLARPPDLLVTNYSMLEYMLMRPLERPIFDATRAWLSDNEEERLLLVVDEAHLYRGAAGAEVGLLLRRLRARLGIPPERLQVIATSASFNEATNARTSAAQLSGKAESDFDPIEGELALRRDEGRGAKTDAIALSTIPLEDFYAADTEEARLASIAPLLQFRKVTPDGSVPRALHEALGSYPPMSLLVNLTMQEARPLEELGREIFAIDDAELADRALTTLIALGSVARRSDNEPGLLPCRVHTFFRGLPGLWACSDATCRFIDEDLDRGPVGRLFAQPHDVCDCGARVFEFFTCRHCGASYLRAYTDDVESPDYLWAEPGGQFLAVGGVATELQPVDLCLEDPIPEGIEPADLDLITGRLNPQELGGRTRQVFLRQHNAEDASSEETNEAHRGREFRPCGICGQSGTYGRSSVQDHQTKGDQPFQALVTRQIQVQPPGRQAASEFAPLRGRKVLAFSDSRQAAARLAPNLQTYSMRDVLRPLILVGVRELQRVEVLAPLISLDDLYLAVLLGARVRGVRLRPSLRAGESLQAQQEVHAAVAAGATSDPTKMLSLFVRVRAQSPPDSLLRGLVATVTDRYYGLQSLALASLVERGELSEDLAKALPDIPPGVTTDAQRLALVRLWLNQWPLRPGIWFSSMTPAWWQTSGGVRAHSGKFVQVNRWLGTPAARRVFDREWLPNLHARFCEPIAENKYRIQAANLTLSTEPGWGYCEACRTTQRLFPGLSRCINCSRDRVHEIDPESDPVFAARKGYYRNSTVRALADPPEPPLSIIAAEHTAQLSAAQADEVFSKAEEHELLFQDVDLGPGPAGQPRPAIDVLSCTTTMEVGIDIGTLSGAALRNMPPSRASYQQRAGRAGRRGNSVATVVAFGSADSHDEHYFREPDAMIRGRVDDPLLTLDNTEIAQRHVTAFLLQCYLQARLPAISPEDQPQLFEVLGSVEAFRRTDTPLNRTDFECWLVDEEAALKTLVADWLPDQLPTHDRDSLLAELTPRTLEAIDGAIEDDPDARSVEPPNSEHTETIAAADDPEAADPDFASEPVEAQAEEGEERSDPSRVAENLLDRLLYKGVLPRYAFPTDVVGFHVFDQDRSTRFRSVFQYAPSQGLPVALSQYAPGKEIWIDGKLWTSGALYSPMRSELFMAWRDKRLYFECSVCHYASTVAHDKAERGEVQDCPACGGEDSFGKARNWIRPPGFAHPCSIDEGTSPDDQPATSYATRAKLVAPGPADVSRWRAVTDRIREYYARTYLLVTNSGPRREGYTYCTRCGLIEPTAVPSVRLAGPHPKPFPDLREPDCPGGGTTRGLVLGTDFISDVLLISLNVEPPLTLRPGHLATDVALRTLSEALTMAATTRLEVEPGELQAEYRPALTSAGREGLEVEIYLYDTLAGGAGFSRRISDLGRTVFEDALALLESCPENCDRSCYRCLRSFKNRFEHDLLDRYLGASLLRYLLDGTAPILADARSQLAADRVFEDLTRLDVAGVRFGRSVAVDLPGMGSVVAPILAETSTRRWIVGIHGPLTPDQASDDGLRDAKEYGGEVPVLLLDEIVVARNLPRASRQVIDTVS